MSARERRQPMWIDMPQLARSLTNRILKNTENVLL